MTVYQQRSRSKLGVVIAAVVTFLATLTLLWTDAAGTGF